MECDKNKGKKLGTSVSYMQWCLHSFPIFPFFLFPLELFLFNPSCHMRSLYAYRIWFLYNKQLSIAIQCSQLRFSFIADFCCVCVCFFCGRARRRRRLRAALMQMLRVLGSPHDLCMKPTIISILDS